MKKYISLLLLLVPLFVNAQQIAFRSGFFGKVPYGFWDNPDTKDMVVVCQGYGEVVTDLVNPPTPTGVLSKNSFASNAFTAKYPFDILVVGNIKGPDGKPAQGEIVRNLGWIVKSFTPRRVVLTGYSYGGQAAAGFKTKSRNSGELVTQYAGSEIFDGYIIICGKAPGSPDYAANLTKPVLLIHGSADASGVGIFNSNTLMNGINATKPPHKIYATHSIKGSPVVCTPLVMPDTAVSKFIVIPNGGHSTAWIKAYDLTSDVGKHVDQFLDYIFAPDPAPPLVELRAKLDTTTMRAYFFINEEWVEYYVSPAWDIAN